MSDITISFLVLATIVVVCAGFVGLGFWQLSRSMPSRCEAVAVWHNELPAGVVVVDEAGPIGARILPRCPCSRCLAIWRGVFGRDDLPVDSPIPEGFAIAGGVLPCYSVPIRSTDGRQGVLKIPAVFVRLRVGVLEMDG